MKIHFITFGSKAPIDFTFALERIKKEAKETKWFDNINIYTPEKLNTDFKTKYQDILKINRGSGSYIWKMQVIKQQLDLVNENDIIVFMDAGSSINKFAKERFYQYIEMLNNSPYGFLAFAIAGGRNYLIQELIDYFNKDKFVIDKELLDKNNYISGHLIIQKNDHSRLIIKEYNKVLEYDRYLITDKYSKINKKLYPYFKGNRHEQSILSLLFKLHGCLHVNDPHYFGNQNEGLNNPESKKYPFLAIRQRSATLNQMKKHDQNLIKILANSKKRN